MATEGSDEEGSAPARVVRPVSERERADTYRLTEQLWREIEANLRSPPLRYVRIRD